MICEHCHGTGKLWVAYWLPVAGPGAIGLSARWERVSQVPCPDCGGSGRTHCCEGERPMEHIASPECWCGPVQDTEEPNVWVHKI